MTKQWYHVEKGEKKGPLTREELKGSICKESLLWKEGMADWMPAEQIEDLKDLFELSPPPIPDSVPLKKEVQKYTLRLTSSLYSSWTLIVLILLAGFMEYTGEDKGKFYSLVLFLTLILWIRVFGGLKIYLTKFLNYQKANANIYWVIGTSIPMYLYYIVNSHYNLEINLSEINYNWSLGILLLIFIFYAIHSIRFFIKLIKLDGLAMPSFKWFAQLEIIAFVALFAVYVILDEEKDPVLFTSLLQAIPLYFLAKGFKEVEKAYLA